MTNPSNIIGTPAAFNGRTSVKAYNDLVQAFSRGIVSGWACAPKSGMTVNVGGNAGTRDVAIAEDASGNRTLIDNRLGTACAVTIDTAPSANSRKDVIVAYVDPTPTGDGSTQDNPAPCGIIAVKGTAAASPVVPTEATIRTAITSDGGTGASAYYVILATITVGANVTTIGSGVITQGDAANTGLITIPTPAQTTKVFVPDYATNPTQITTLSYTVTEAGFIRITSAAAACTASINGRMIFDSYYRQNSLFYPVGKGDIYVPSTNDGNVMLSHFYKGIWKDAA